MAADPNIIANSGLAATGFGADDYNWAFFTKNSGLTPAKDYSVTSHKIAYFRRLLGPTFSHIDDLNKAWKDSGRSYVNILAAESFTGSDGSAWPSQFTLKSGPAQTIQGGRGQLTASGASYATTRLDLGSMPSTKASEITGNVILDANGENYLCFGLCSDQGGTTEAGANSYAYLMGTGGSASYIRVRSGGTASDYAGSNYPAGQLLRFRFQRTATQLRARAWLASSAEPSSWDIFTPAAGDFSGVASVGFQNGNATTARTATVDDLVVSPL